MKLMTKSQQAETYLREAIKNGRWAVGERLPVEDELMSELSVSKGTIREALNGLAGTGLIVRQPKRGTFVTRVPAVGNVAIVSEAKLLASQTMYIDMHIVDLAHRLIADSGYRPLMSIGHGNGPEAFVSSLHLFERSVMKDTAGVLNAVFMADVEERLAAEHVPCVNINYGVPMHKHSVLFDLIKAYELAAELLRACGYDDFAVMGVDFSQESIGDAVRQATRQYERMTKAKLRISDDQFVRIPFTLDYRDAVPVFREWLERPNRPRAMFFTDDCLLEAVSPLIMSLGVRIPEELAIVTVANAGRRYTLPTPLMRLEFDAEVLVGTAWDMLCKLMNGEPVDQPVIHIPPVRRNGESL